MLPNVDLKEKIKYIHDYMVSSNAATASKVDENSNVTQKTIAGLEAELFKPDTIQINRKLVKDKLTQMFGEDMAKAYEDDLAKHYIYTHDETSLKPYCASITLYPFLLEGTKCLGGVSKAPKNLQSFCGSFVNLVYQIASNFSGAIATVEFLHMFDYFARKQWGKDYLGKHFEEVAQEFQGVVYALNQPASARGDQSVFWNISVFDHDYLKEMFGGFYYPDGTQVDIESTYHLQRYFLQWFRQEREKELLTFPVVTAALLTDGKGGFKDNDFMHALADEQARGLSFFVYMSDKVDSLASCCFDANQRVLVRNEDGVKLIRIGDFKYMKNLTIFFDGSWVKGSFVKTAPTDKMYRIVTSNKKEVLCTSNHIFPTLAGDKRADEITTDDWLMFNDRAYKEGSGEYKDGFLIGMYLGDGSMYERNDCDSIEVTLSLNEYKVKKCIEYISGWRIHPSKNNVVFAKTSDKSIVAFIRRWVKGGKCNTKELNMDVCNKSLEFRRGILDGFYATDGGNSNRIYTTSKKLVEQMEAMLTTMGVQTIIDKSDRTNEMVIIRGEEFTRNFPLYCLRWYEPQNKRSMGDVYKLTLNGTFFKVSEVQEITNYDAPVYCFNMADGKEPYFTLANGIQTHNCRLRNELADNTFSYTLGAGGVVTGSARVISLNINRIGQCGIKLDEVVDRVHKYLLAHREVLKGYIDAGLLPAYTQGFMDIDKQFLTLGVNGVLEYFEYLRDKKGEVTDKEYPNYLQSLLSFLTMSNKAALSEYGVRFNTEFVPAENLGVKNAKWDKEAGLYVPRDCYNSYFYPVEDTKVNVLDKLKLYSKDIVQYLDGGSALHLNLEQMLSAEQFVHLYKLCSKYGVQYWTTNVLCTICNDCGYINTDTENHCVKCGSTDVDYGTRVIGYLKRISNFSEARQKEAGKRFYHHLKK